LKPCLVLMGRMGEPMNCDIMRVRGADTPLPYSKTHGGEPVTKRILSQKTLKELIHYDPDTGIFTWLERGRKWFKSASYCKRWNTRYAGNQAGCLDFRGYVQMRVNDVHFYAHRLAFLYMNGIFPPQEVDHINHHGEDNRWENLREATLQENQKNQSLASNNKSGYLGVCWNTSAKRWRAQIRVNGKYKHLGDFKEIEDAATARKAASIKYGYHENHGRIL